jgi:hypothetical protein
MRGSKPKAGSGRGRLKRRWTIRRSAWVEGFEITVSDDAAPNPIALVVLRGYGLTIYTSDRLGDPAYIRKLKALGPQLQSRVLALLSNQQFADIVHGDMSRACALGLLMLGYQRGQDPII